MFLKRNNKHLCRFVIIFLIFCISLITFIFLDFTEELTGIQYFGFLFFYIEFIFYILGILLLYISNKTKYIKLYTLFYCGILIINILVLIIEYFNDKEIFLGVLCTIFRVLLILALLYYQVKFCDNEKNISNVKIREVKIDIDESDIKNSNIINIKEEDVDKKEQKGNETDKITFQGDKLDQFSDQDITQTKIYNNNDNKKGNDNDNKLIKGKKRLQYWKNKRNFFINYTRYISKRAFGNKDENLKRKSPSLEESSKSLSRSVNKSIRSHKSHKSSVKAPSNEEAYCYSFFIDESIMVPGYHTNGVKTIYIDDALPIAKPKPIYSCSDDNSSSITQKIQESIKNKNKRRVIKEVYHHDYTFPSTLEKGSKEIIEDYDTVMETDSEIGNEAEIDLGLGLDLDMNLDIDFDLEIENETEVETELDCNHYYSNKDMLDMKNEIKKEDNITLNSMIDHQSYSPQLSAKNELEEGSLIVSIDQNNELNQSRLSGFSLSSPTISPYSKDKDNSFLQDLFSNYNSEQENNSNLVVNINQKYTSPSLLHYSPQIPLPVASQSSLSLPLIKESLSLPQQQQQQQYKDHYNHHLQYHPSTILSTVSSIRSSTAGDNESDGQSLAGASEFNNHKSLIRANANSITSSTTLTPSTPTTPTTPTTLIIPTMSSTPSILTTPTAFSTPSTLITPSLPTTLITPTSPTTLITPTSPTTLITPTSPTLSTIPTSPSTTISTITNTTNVIQKNQNETSSNLSQKEHSLKEKKRKHHNHKHHHKHRRHTSDKEKKSKDTGSEIDSSATENKKKKSKKKEAIHLDNLMIPESMNILKEDLIHYNYSKYDFPPSPSSLSSSLSSPSSPGSSFKTESPLIKRFY